MLNEDNNIPITEETEDTEITSTEETETIVSDEVDVADEHTVTFDGESAGEGSAFDFKKVIKVGVFAVLFVGIIVAAVCLGGRFSPYDTATDLILFYGNEKTVIAYNDGSKVEVDALMTDYQMSLDGSIAAFMADRDHDGGGTLYYVSGSGDPVNVSDGVYDYFLATSGKGLIYWTGFNIETGVGELQLFDGKETTKINDNVLNGAVISPDGKTVFYVTSTVDEEAWVEKTDGFNVVEHKSFISTNGNKGEAFEIDSVEPVAIADGAKYLYYVRREAEDESAHLVFAAKAGVQSDSDTVLITLSDVQQNLHIGFNNDNSQIVFNDDEDSFISINAGERVIINSKHLIKEFIVPETTPIGGIIAVVYGFSDFRGKVFETEEGLFLLNDNLDRERITGSSIDVTMSADGKQLYHIDEDYLRVASAINSGRERIIIAENVQNYVIDSSGNLYYIDNFNVLYRKGARDLSADKGTKVADFAATNSLEISGRGTVFFVGRNEEGLERVLYSVNGTKVEKVADDVEIFEMFINNVFYYTRNEEGAVEAYRSNGNNRFSLFSTGVLT